MTGFRPHRVFAIGLTLACAGVLPAFGATGSPPEVAASSPEAARIRGPESAVPDSWIYVIDEPGVYLDRACNDLRRRQRPEAASDVRRAAALIDIEATRAKGADRARLKRDASELLQLADQIEAGRLADAKRLSLAVAIARVDLGIHHDLRAAAAWMRHDRLAAGRSLAAAGRYVNGASSGLDEKVPASLSEELHQAEGLGDRLAHGAEDTSESAWTRAREALRRAFRLLDEKLEAKSAAPG